MYPDIVYSLWTPDTYFRYPLHVTSSIAQSLRHCCWFRNGISTEIVQTHANKIGLIVKIDTAGQIMVTKRFVILFIPRLYSLLIFEESCKTLVRMLARILEDLSQFLV